MTGEIVNLNKARKAKAKTDAKAKAVANRAKHGETTAERAVKLIERLRAEKKLDAHKRDED